MRYDIFWVIFGITIIILGIIAGIYIRCSKKSCVIDWRNKYSKRDFKIAFYGLVITLIGIFFGVFDDILSQYSTRFDPFIKLYEKKHVENISKFNNNEATIVFVLDVSGSLKEFPPITVNEDIKKQIRDIKTSGFCEATYTYYDSYLNENKEIKIKASDLFKLRLLYLLTELKTAKCNFAIVTFANNAEYFVSPQPVTYENLKKAFSKVVPIDFGGGKTDFCGLFETISKSISDLPENDYSKMVDYSYIFLSDYIHDSGNKSNDVECIKKQLTDISSKRIFLNFYTLKENKRTINEYKTKNVISIRDEVFNAGNEFTCNRIDISEAYLLCKRNTEHSIPFYYRNYLYEKQLSTFISFKEEKKAKKEKPKTFKFNLSYADITQKDNKQQFKIESSRTEKATLTEESQRILSLVSNDEVELIMSGHIPSQYPYASIIIEDVDNKVKYDAEIVFIKKLPSYLRWVIPLFWAIFITYLIFTTFINRMQVHRNQPNPVYPISFNVQFEKWVDANWIMRRFGNNLTLYDERGTSLGESIVTNNPINIFIPPPANPGKYILHFGKKGSGNAQIIRI